MEELFDFDELSVVFRPQEPIIELGVGDEEVVFYPQEPIIPIGIGDLPELDVA